MGPVMCAALYRAICLRRLAIRSSCRSALLSSTGNSRDRKDGVGGSILDAVNLKPVVLISVLFQNDLDVPIAVSICQAHCGPRRHRRFVFIGPLESHLPQPCTCELWSMITIIWQTLSRMVLLHDNNMPQRETNLRQWMPKP